MKKKLAIITTHPIQYNAPLFELLQQRKNIDLHVFYTWGESVLENKYDPGFKAIITWDIPLLLGYPYTFLENTASRKGSDHFRGINNPGIIKAIKAYQPDIILVYGWSFKSHFNVLRYFKRRLPILFRGDSTLLDELGGVKTIIRRLFLKWIYSHISAALFTGKSNYDYFKQAGLKDKQLVFVPHTIDNTRFSEHLIHSNKGSMKLREDLGIAAADFVFLFAGKLEPKKSPGLLLSAFCDAGFDKTVHLVIAGAGVLGDALRMQYADDRQIHFTGFINQSLMPELYQAADVVILPSGGPGETWGLTINEALVCSKPVIVSDHCGCAADLVKDGINGYIFKAGNKANLQEKLQHIYQQRDIISAMGNASKEIIENYSMDIAAIGIETSVMNFGR